MTCRKRYALTYTDDAGSKVEVPMSRSTLGRKRPRKMTEEARACARARAANPRAAARLPAPRPSDARTRACLRPSACALVRARPPARARARGGGVLGRTVGGARERTVPSSSDPGWLLMLSRWREPSKVSRLESDSRSTQRARVGVARPSTVVVGSGGGWVSDRFDGSWREERNVCTAALQTTRAGPPYAKVTRLCRRPRARVAVRVAGSRRRAQRRLSPSRRRGPRVGDATAVVSARREVDEWLKGERSSLHIEESSGVSPKGIICIIIGIFSLLFCIILGQFADPKPVRKKR